MKRLRTALVLLAATAACRSGPPADLEPGPALSRYTEAQVVDEARALLGQLGVPAGETADLLAELDVVLRENAFRSDAELRGIRAVCAFGGGTGGLLVSGGGAKGLASFRRGRSAVPFDANTLAVGGIVGGRAYHGIGLVLGLEHEGWFPGEYDGTAVSATAIEASVASGRLDSEWFDHSVRTITVGSGMGASAGHVEVTITWGD